MAVFLMVRKVVEVMGGINRVGTVAEDMAEGMVMGMVEDMEEEEDMPKGQGMVEVLDTDHHRGHHQVLVMSQHTVLRKATDHHRATDRLQVKDITKASTLKVLHRDTEDMKVNMVLANLNVIAITTTVATIDLNLIILHFIKQTCIVFRIPESYRYFYSQPNEH